MYPTYTAHVPFRVAAPVVVIGDDHLTAGAPLDVEAIIPQVETLLHTESFLEEALRAPEFHKRGDGTPGESAWLADHKGEEVDALKRDVQLVHSPRAGNFDVTMTTYDKAEAAALASAVGRALQVRLDLDFHGALAGRLKTLNEIRSTLQSTFDLERESLASWSKVNDVDVRYSRYEVEKTALQTYTEAEVKARAESVAAEARLREINARVQDKKPVFLPAEVEREIEQYEPLRQLVEARYTLAQELAAERNALAPSRERITDKQTRLDTITEQMAGLREEKRRSATERYVQQLTQAADEKKAVVAYLERERVIRNETVIRIGEKIAEYQQRATAVKQKEDMLLRANHDYQLTMLNSHAASSPVIALASASIPREPSGPRWRDYLEVGAAAGACIGILVGIRCLAKTPTSAPPAPGADNPMPPASTPPASGPDIRPPQESSSPT
jgi:hypothetical protein